MAGTKAIIADEEGQAWLIVAGDPTWPAIAVLHKQHRSVIILPRAFIIRQVPVNPETIEERIQRLSVAVEATTDAETFTLVAAAYEKLVCQHDCLTVVWGDIIKTEGL